MDGSRVMRPRQICDSDFGGDGEAGGYLIHPMALSWAMRKSLSIICFLKGQDGWRRCDEMR